MFSNFARAFWTVMFVFGVFILLWAFVREMVTGFSFDFGMGFGLGAIFMLLILWFAQWSSRWSRARE